MKCFHIRIHVETMIWSLYDCHMKLSKNDMTNSEMGSIGFHSINYYLPYNYTVRLFDCNKYVTNFNDHKSNFDTFTD